MLELNNHIENFGASGEMADANNAVIREYPFDLTGNWVPEVFVKSRQLNCDKTGRVDTNLSRRIKVSREVNNRQPIQGSIPCLAPKNSLFILLPSIKVTGGQRYSPSVIKNEGTIKC